VDKVTAVKVALVPALIGLSSIIGRRYGPVAGGWFAAFPLTSGPIVLVLGLQHGPQFAAQACTGILLAVCSLAAFAMVYSVMSQSREWPACSVAACGVYLATAVALQRVIVPLWTAYLLANLALWLGLRLVPRGNRERIVTVPMSSWDVPLRMLVAAALVWTISYAAERLGPRLSGLLTPFPVAACILAAGTHRVAGPEGVQIFLRSLLSGMPSAAAFFLIAGLSMPRVGVEKGILCAVGSTVLMQGGLLVLNRNMRFAASPKLAK
jgi:hypothetical protein